MDIKPHDGSDGSMDAFIESALSRYANVVPPAGLERRILSRISQRQGRERTTRRLAGVLLFAAALLAGVMHPFDGFRTAVVESAPAIADSDVRSRDVEAGFRTANVGPAEPILDHDKRKRPLAPKKPSLISEIETPDELVVPKRGLVSDIKLDSVGMSSLTLTSLSSLP